MTTPCAPKTGTSVRGKEGLDLPDWLNRNKSESEQDIAWADYCQDHDIVYTPPDPTVPRAPAPAVIETPQEMQKFLGSVLEAKEKPNYMMTDEEALREYKRTKDFHDWVAAGRPVKGRRKK